jgi:hypothetical protein
VNLLPYVAKWALQILTREDWFGCNVNNSYPYKSEAGQREKKERRCYPAGFENGGRGCEAVNADHL